MAVPPSRWPARSHRTSAAPMSQAVRSHRCCRAAVRFVPLSRRARDLVSAWLDERGRHPGPAWHGQRGPLTISGITQVVLAVGADAGIPGLRPHRCRHTFGTRLRQGGADPAQVQALLGHASIDTAARYFRSGSAENAAVIERIFDN